MPQYTRPTCPETPIEPNPVRRGLLASIGAYLVWGLFPLYWKLLARVPVLQVLAHRALWCAAFVWLWLILRGEAGWWRGAPVRLLLMLTVSSVLISVNWGMYIFAVTTGHVLDTSLGYFITPLVSVLFGVVVFRERLGVLQWLAVIAASVGVLWLTFGVGRLPWIALILAFSFGSYGLVRKVAVVEPIHGLAMESVIVLPVALGFLAWTHVEGAGVFGHEPLWMDALLVLGGLVTAVPLAMFAYGARRVPMTMLGFLQYLAPTLQLLLGVYLYDEPFGHTQAVAFGFIWVAVALYSFDGLRAYLRNLRAASAG